eukprot:GFYU01034696.1.p1 GENE.GFYU01034696.1~~GFYU01034696.1.p1  ORF type:complete len:246 (+),score=30.67 GFYU01034696.1:35-772(+)
MPSDSTSLVECDPTPEFMSKMGEDPTFAANANIRSWTCMPNSLHFQGTVPPSSQCMTILEGLAEITKDLEGYYGAGGGQVHTLYVGIVEGHATSFPPLQALLQGSRVEKNLPWGARVDPCHQHLFPRLKSETDSDDGKKLEQIDALLSSSGSVRTLPFQYPSYVSREHPYLAEHPPCLLYVEPNFSMMHDGGCPEGCEKSDSILVERLGDGTVDDGDVSEAPCFAYFQIEGTGEIVALCNWDYRD